MKKREPVFLPNYFFTITILTGFIVFLLLSISFAGSYVMNANKAFVADGPVFIDSLNANQIALKRSYLRMNSSANFSLGANTPSGIAFDGANIWVVSKDQGKLDILRANNGESVITDRNISSLCDQPNALAYDGKNMWVACRGSAKVAVLDGITGNQAQDPNTTPIPPISVGAAPVYLLFDGEFMWVANDGDTLSIINTNDRSIATVTLPNVGGPHLPYGMASDGTNIWVVNRNYWPVNVYKISDRTKVGMSPDQGSNALDVEFDGVNMWITNYEHDQITILKASDGSHVRTLTSGDGVGDKPTYLHFDGLHMWIAHEGASTDTDGTASIFRAHDFAYMGVANVGKNPQRIAFDGVNMWILVGGANNVVKR